MLLRDAFRGYNEAQGQVLEVTHPCLSYSAKGFAKMTDHDLTSTHSNNQLSALSAEEQQALLESEQDIQDGFERFAQAGLRFEQIRDRRLYKSTHSSFEDYCLERWNLSKAYVNRIIAAADVVRSLRNPPKTKTLPSGKVETIVSEVGKNKPSEPVTVSQAVELRNIEADKRAAVFTKAVEQAGGKQPTAAQIKQVVQSSHYPGQLVFYNGSQRRVHSANNDGSVNLRSRLGGSVAEMNVFLDDAARPPTPRQQTDRFQTEPPAEALPFSSRELERRVIRAAARIDADLRLALSSDERLRLLQLRAELVGGLE